MQKAQRILILLAIVLIAATIGITAAFMFRKTEGNGTFAPAKVSCEASEEFDGVTKQNIRVENTGNYPAYIRLRVVSYWRNAEGERVGQTCPMPKITLCEGWITDDEQTFYYTKPVEPQMLTPVLCEPFDLQTGLDVVGNVLYQNVELLAETIQARPAEAMQVWNVTTDEDGRLTLQ